MCILVWKFYTDISVTQPDQDFDGRIRLKCNSGVICSVSTVYDPLNVISAIKHPLPRQMYCLQSHVFKAVQTDVKSETEVSKPQFPCKRWKQLSACTFADTSRRDKPICTKHEVGNPEKCHEGNFRSSETKYHRRTKLFTSHFPSQTGKFPTLVLYKLSIKPNTCSDGFGLATCYSRKSVDAGRQSDESIEHETCHSVSVSLLTTRRPDQLQNFELVAIIDQLQKRSHNNNKKK